MQSLRRAFQIEKDTLSKTENNQVFQLVQASKHLLHDEGRLDLKSEAGYNACTQFLTQLDMTARSFDLPPAPRAYRSNFTINYRALFPDEARHYRVDILEASAEQYKVIWVNGQDFEFSSDAMQWADALQASWFQLTKYLSRWESNAKPTANEVRQALMQLDSSWASFEQIYIGELISIEEKARNLVVDAVEIEHTLTQLEKQLQSTRDALQYDQIETQAKREMSNLIRSIAKLNSVANVRGKGRDDLSPEILFAARRALMKPCTGGDTFENEISAAARNLATDVVEAFDTMRNYLRQVSKCLERVDPHLCNNAGLVARLVDWEESWEVGAKYVLHAPLLHAVCDVVATVRTAQRLAPKLVEMCNDCDVELFMVLPRIIWLRFLAFPAGMTELLKTLLPHRFKGDRADEGLSAFIDKFVSVQEMFSGHIDRSSVDPQTWETLVKRLVLGEGGNEIYGHLLPTKRQVVEPAVEDLVRELEGFSMELQRHCAADWNQCSSILIQCLQKQNGDDQEDDQEHDGLSV